jgi:hypothetical protein
LGRNSGDIFPISERVQASPVKALLVRDTPPAEGGWATPFFRFFSFPRLRGDDIPFGKRIRMPALGGQRAVAGRRLTIRVNPWNPCRKSSCQSDVGTRGREGTRVIALSMHDEPERMETRYRAGAESYVLKTAPSQELLAAIRGGGRSPTTDHS